MHVNPQSKQYAFCKNIVYDYYYNNNINMSSRSASCQFCVCGKKEIPVFVAQSSLCRSAARPVRYDRDKKKKLSPKWGNPSRVLRRCLNNDLLRHCETGEVRSSAGFWRASCRCGSGGYRMPMIDFSRREICAVKNCPCGRGQSDFRFLFDLISILFCLAWAAWYCQDSLTPRNHLLIWKLRPAGLIDGSTSRLPSGIIKPCATACVTFLFYIEIYLGTV